MLKEWPIKLAAHAMAVTRSLSGKNARMFHAARKRAIPVMQHHRATLKTNRNLDWRVRCRSATNSATLSCISCGANAIELAFLSSSMATRRRAPSEFGVLC